MASLLLKTRIGEKNARIYGHIFKIAHLPLKTLIKEKNARVFKNSENAASTLMVTRHTQLLFTFKRKEQK